MRDKIKLVSSANTGHYYTTTKNKRTMPDKLELKKYYGILDLVALIQVKETAPTMGPSSVLTPPSRTMISASKDSGIDI